jgi:hypothetical protein
MIASFPKEVSIALNQLVIFCIMEMPEYHSDEKTIYKWGQMSNYDNLSPLVFDV